MKFKPIRAEEFIADGCSLTWDAEANAGYLHVYPNPDAWAARTIGLSDSVQVDVDVDGLVRGIETFGHPVGIADMLTVLRWLSERQAGTGPIQ